MDSAIVVDKVVKRYIVKSGVFRRRTSVVEALKGISFTVDRGEVHALLGPNGAGKTTTVKILATLLLPDSGDAYILGHSVTKEADTVRRLVGVVLDVSKGFYPYLTGYENLMFYALLRGLPRREAKARVREVLELVGLKDAANRSYLSYSMGMRARLSIAKVLIDDPEVLLLDEPTLGLDVHSARFVRSLILDLAKRGKTILVTGHNMFEIEQIASKITVINRGVVVASGSPQSLREKIGLVHRVEINVHAPGESDVEPLLAAIGSRLKLEKSSVEAIAENQYRIVLYVAGSREYISSNVFDVLRTYGIKVLDVKIIEPTLEDLYLALVR